MNRSISAALMLAAVVAGCGSEGADVHTTADSSAVATTPDGAAQPVAPAAVTAEQFADLRWIEGTWRGTGGDQAAFYERYTFVDDSTIRSESASDSTFPGGQHSEIRLRGGRVATGNETMEWQATSLDARSIRFDPVRGANNAFVWTTESDSAWVARLSWRDRSGEMQERVYQMRRMR